MSQYALPEVVRKIIDAEIESSVALELLLVLYHEPHREWTAAEVAKQMRIDPDWVRTRLRGFVRSGLVCQTGAAPHGYRYYPASLERNAAVAALARAYSESWQSVIAYIHSRPHVALNWVVDALRARGWINH